MPDVPGTSPPVLTASSPSASHSSSNSAIHNDNNTSLPPPPETPISYEHSLHTQCSRSEKIYTSLAAGSIAGALAKSTIAPLDRTKIHFQIGDRSYSFKKAVRFVLKSAQTDGVRSLWRGNSATVIRIVPYAGINFASHEQWKDIIGAQTRTSTPVRRFLAGSLAGTTATVITYPLDLVRARMAVSDRCQYKNMISVFQKMVADEGLFSLYRGFLPTIIGIIPYAGTSFFVYETLKKNHYEDPEREGEPTQGQRALYGACAGLLGQAVAYPLDIVRRRMQTARLKNRTLEYRTIKSTFLFVLKKEGRKGLYKGLSMNFIKGPIATGISFSTNDWFKTKLREWVVGCD